MPALLNPRQVAERLNVSRSFVYKMADKGVLPSVRFCVPTNGKRAKQTVRFKERDVTAFLAHSYSQAK